MDGPLALIMGARTADKVPVDHAPAPRSHRFTGVEGLRGVAAFAVLLTHVYLGGAPAGSSYDLGLLDPVARTAGTAGVVLFFTLSGFLLYRPFAAAVLDGRDGPPVRAYLRNRFLRIAPAYWLAVLGAGLVLRSTYLPPGVAEGRSLASEPDTLVVNLLLVQGYSPSTLGTGIGPAWSLGVEVVFYLVLPVLAGGAALLAARTAVGRRRPVVAALLPAALCLVLGQVGTKLAYALPDTYGEGWTGTWFAVVLRSFVGQASLFAGGLALAVLYCQLRRSPVVLPRWWRPAAAVVAAVVAVGATLVWNAQRITESRATLAMSVAAVLLLALVVLPTVRTPRWLAVLESRPLLWAGLLSYGVFLWHDPLVVWLRLQGWTRPGLGGFALALLLTAGVSTAVAAASWFAVERPALSLKRSAGTAPSAPDPVALPTQSSPSEAQAHLRPPPVQLPTQVQPGTAEDAQATSDGEVEPDRPPALP